MVEQTGTPYESVFAVPNDAECRVTHCGFLCLECGTVVDNLSFDAIARGEYREIDGIIRRRFDYARQPAGICECVDHIWLTDGDVSFAITFGSVPEKITVPIRRKGKEAW